MSEIRVIPTGPVGQQIDTLFVLLDTSGSVADIALTAALESLNEVFKDLAEFNDNNDHVLFQIALLKISTDPSWISAKALEPNRNTSLLSEQLRPEGLSNFEMAFHLLNEALSEDSPYFYPGPYAPLVLLLSDGKATSDFSKSLAELKQNPYFLSAHRIFGYFGSTANPAMAELQDFLKEGQSPYPFDPNEVNSFAHKIIKSVTNLSSTMKEAEDPLKEGQNDGDLAFHDPREENAKKDSPEDVYSPAKDPLSNPLG